MEPWCTTTCADKNGITTDVNLVVGTTNNNAPINLSVRKAATALIKNWQVSNGLLNMVEMAYRAYDPCNSLRDAHPAGPDADEGRDQEPDGSVFKRYRTSKPLQENLFLSFYFGLQR